MKQVLNLNRGGSFNTGSGCYIDIQSMSCIRNLTVEAESVTDQGIECIACVT